MFGALLLCLFLMLGVLISNRVLNNESVSIRIWSGSLFGMLIMMWVPIIFAFIFGFSIFSHILAVLTMIGVYWYIRKAFPNQGSFKYEPDKTDIAMFLVAVPIFVLMVFLLNSHVLAPGENGGLYSGQSTFGDLCLHTGIITSIATQGHFPPDYSIYPGFRLCYPFLVNSLSASMYLFGTSLRWSILIPSYILSFMLFCGFFIFAYEILSKRCAAMFSAFLFFFNGGIGFIYFMDGLRKDPSNFNRIFTEWYHTPTNYNEHYVRWSNVICDMIIPQRTTLIGWTYIFLSLWLLYKAIIQKDKKYFVLAGIVSGLMPMIHTHSYFAIGIIAFFWIIVYLFDKKIGTKEYIKNWLYFVIPAVLLSMPQLLYWTFSQVSQGNFLQFQQGGWQANENDEFLWFWIKNVG